jgi:hypothetical protein
LAGFASGQPIGNPLPFTLETEPMPILTTPEQFEDDKPGHWWHMLADSDATELTDAHQRENNPSDECNRLGEMFAN